MRYGHFDNEKKEYVIDNVALPASWTNYLGVKDTCVVINHTAGGYMFYKSPEYHRVTRFRGNAVPMDRPGHYVYIRDNDNGDYFSISWQPVGKPLDKAQYKCRHGLSYSIYECLYDKIKASQRMTVPMDDDVELWDVVIKNTDDKPRNLSIFSYCEFSFHHIMIDNQNFQMSLYCAGSSYEDGVIEHDLFYEEFGYQYFTSNFEPDGFDCLRDKFIGLYHTEDNPIAVVNGKCSGSFEKGNNHCGSLQKNIILEPGEEIRLVFMLGEGNREKGKEIREKYSNFENVDNSYKQLEEYWADKMSRLQINTPNEGMNTMINIWNLYQSEVNIMFSRFASFIELGGRTGLGYRDTAQDSMTIPHSNPEKCKERILQLLNGLVSEGYGLHLFSPEWFEKKEEKKKPFKSPTVIPGINKKDIIHGIEDACSDDALWLIPSIVEYIKETGDLAFADREVDYADKGRDRVYDHMKSILDFSDREVGKTGVCKGLRADWNDCLNLGGGESAMVSFLHYWAINSFLELAGYLGRDDDVEKYTAMACKVKKVCETQLWDGDWYIRGITKNLKKIGTKNDVEGKVHLESNAWAVLSGASDYERGIKAMDSVHKYLATKYGIMLNAPSYTVPDDDIGFVTRVYPGVKENGSIFSHPNPWAWAAECVLGRGDRAMEYYNSLCPYNQNDMIEIRESEPYSYCQFIMGKDHTAFGRARHPFMTGSGGWSYFSATRYMLGIRPDFDKLEINPCIPADWKQFSAVRKWRGATYNITVLNPDAVMKGVKGIKVNGEIVPEIRVLPEGTVNEIEVVLG
ncbi:N,N'-diacetylchitobiose phosphorylase [Eubacterium sp. AF15-50]|uniref:GH36-type glycosyl hydrolase domain-containing protein n=1 Tax=unclassified Eubacterium (in: firmicutes) TaxID=2624479 RepID=UPI000E533FFF|nr:MULTISPECIES: N,N'-diacetylchitobiose phosphorylase [unclassified Eubacterium (in: firmicutes)]RHR74310.1 N,N'-diacetylchitobiose phosphorylase [Eubacterium sp. AF16-48]RHR81844.1 N,N'-diacetylchitobiose phosphorylase [Eubacterium sp. AF15-50]